MRSFFRFALAAVAALASVSRLHAGAIVVASPNFDTVGGKIAGVLDLNPLDPAPASVTASMGSSGWYAQANVAALGNLGFRPDVEVNQAITSPDHGMISFSLGASLGGLAGLEMPEADLWQPMTGVSFAPNTTYTFSLSVDAGSLLDVTALGNRGFGIGFTSGATSSSPGTFVADSLSTPTLLTLTALTGTVEQLVLSYTTGAVAPTGDMGIAVFAGRGIQALNVSLLNDYRMNHAAVASSPSYAAVPEPSVLAHLVGGIAVLAHWRRGRRSSGTSREFGAPERGLAAGK